MPFAAARAQTPAAVPPDSTIAHRVDEYLSRLAGMGFTGGVLVTHHGRTVIARSYGWADQAAGIRADVNTVYNIGSITKQFTAAAILRLEELGKLHTTDTIGRFFPSAPADKRGITLHQLLTHTAGFESDFSPTDYEPTTRDEYMRRMLASRLQFAPGTGFSYANSGYSMLAAIIELVTGKDYEQALTDLVLRPAGMTETGYTAPHWDPRRIAHGYQGAMDWGTIVQRISGPGQPYWELRGNGGLATTLGDWAKWDAALDGHRVLTDSSLRKFTTGYVNEGPLGLSQYAYGWSVQRTKRGTRVITHNGGNGIYVAEWFRFLDDSVSVFLASTRSDMKASPVVRVVTAIVFGEPYELPVRAAAASPAAVAAVTGTWALPDGSTFTIRTTGPGNALVLDAVGQQAFALALTGDTASPPRAAALNAHARDIVAGLVRGDPSRLVAALGPGGPTPAEVAQQERGLMADRLSRLGAYRSFDVLGTAPGPEGMPTTVVRVTFERGVATNRYGWGPDGRIGDIGAQPYQAAPLTPV
ncbi:MAG TPA: serine hydrolase domain-containing protein, partial [Gemmatimonadaceae bacterium]|nr:serine hydrolase domain-containing protein [Gemmatimonadaceae bacterium]